MTNDQFPNAWLAHTDLVIGHWSLVIFKARHVPSNARLMWTTRFFIWKPCSGWMSTRAPFCLSVSPDDRADGCHLDPVERSPPEVVELPVGRDLEHPVHLRGAGEDDGVHGAAGRTADQVGDPVGVGGRGVDVRLHGLHLRPGAGEEVGQRCVALAVELHPNASCRPDRPA